MKYLDLSPAKLYLLSNYPFYYGLLQQTKITFDNSSKYIAAVKVQNTLEMLINPDIFGELSIEDQAGIILHEFGHIFRDHIKQTRIGLLDGISAKLGIQTNHQMANIAMDMEINPSIHEVRNSKVLGIKAKKSKFQTVFPEQFKFETGNSWVNYYALLKSKAKIIESGEGNSHQDHDYFKNSTGDKQLMGEVISNAVKKAKSLSPGATPKEVNDFLFNYEASKQIPWTLVLRQFMQNLVDIKRSSTWKKPSRRFGSQMPGVKKLPKTELLIAIDSSGSVSDKNLKDFYQEVAAINETGLADIEIAVFDTVVHQREVYKKGFEAKRLCQGGTSFVGPHQIAVEERIKGVVFLSDGYAEFPDKNEVTYKCLWVLNNSNVKPPFGNVVTIKNDGNE